MGSLLSRGEDLTMTTGLVATMLMLVSAFSHALFNALTKRAQDKALFRALFLGMAGLGMLPFTLLVPFPEAETWRHLGLSLLIHGAYFHTTIAAFERADMGVVYPVMRGLAPALAAAVAALFLGETLGWPGIAALAGICLTLLAFAWPSRHAPVSGPALGYAVVSAVLIACYSVNDAAGTRSAGSAWTYIVWFFVAVSLPISVSVIVSARHRLRDNLRREALVALPTSVIGITSFAFALYAFSLAPVGPLVALRETSVVFGAILATVLLRESFGMKRIALSVCLAAFLVLLQTVTIKAI